MRIAFLIDPPESFKIYKDSTYAMMREAAGRGHELHILQQEELAWRSGNVSAATQRLHLTGDTGVWFRLDAAQTTALKDFDAVLMRKDPPFDMEYVYSTYLLELAQKEGARVFNDPRAIRDCNEKMTIARFPQFTAPTLVTRNAALIHGFLAEHGDIILKPLDGMGGSSVFRVQGGDPNLNVIIETLTQFGARTIMAQADMACQITDISTSAYPTPAARPLNSRLDCSAFEAEFGVKRPDWRLGLAAILQELSA